MKATSARRAIQNIFGVPPAPLIRRPPRPQPALRRTRRDGWPDLEDVFVRARRRLPSAGPKVELGLTGLTFRDLQRLEQSCYATAGYLDEGLFWWLVERMLESLATG